MYKNNLIIINDLDNIRDIIKIIFEINIPKEEYFSKIVNYINSIENNLFSIDKLYLIDNLSILKKICIYIEKHPNDFYIYKFDLFNSMIILENLYNEYLKKESDYEEINKIENDLTNYINNLKRNLDEINKNKEYYYLKFNFNTNTPYFYLSRRNILNRLKEYGKAYNYIPSSLDDDRYSYFITDFKIDNKIDVVEMLENIKNDDDALDNYEIHKIEKNDNIYNIKIYAKDKKIKNFQIENYFFEKTKFLDMIIYDNLIDIYIYANNQLDVVEQIFNIKEYNINIILSKNINNRETRAFAINGINLKNIEEIKKVIEFTLSDKNINDIIYREEIDFSGFQFLEYLKYQYNISNNKI